ncbi:MAG: hypothetical protein AAF580_10105 [Pseudomonadota bacterium]
MTREQLKPYLAEERVLLRDYTTERLTELADDGVDARVLASALLAEAFAIVRAVDGPEAVQAALERALTTHARVAGFA